MAAEVDEGAYAGNLMSDAVIEKLVVAVLGAAGAVALKKEA